MLCPSVGGVSVRTSGVSSSPAWIWYRPASLSGSGVQGKSGRSPPEWATIGATPFRRRGLGEQAIGEPVGQVGIPTGENRCRIPDRQRTTRSSEVPPDREVHPFEILGDR